MYIPTIPLHLQAVSRTIPMAFIYELETEVFLDIENAEGYVLNTKNFEESF